MTIPKPDILLLSLDDFIAQLRVLDISTFHCVFEASGEDERGRFVASHPILQPLADFFAREATDFDGHEGVFAQLGPKSGVLQNALAGIWWGGGKGVMARNTGHGLAHGASPEARRLVYEEYGTFMRKRSSSPAHQPATHPFHSALKGCYVTAEDVGTNVIAARPFVQAAYACHGLVNDMAAVFSKTRFTTCIPVELGGSGNPSVPTARGVVRGLEAAFDHLQKPLAGSSIAIQGAGHVGLPLVEFLLAKGVGRIVVADVDAFRLEIAAQHTRQLPNGDRVTYELVERGNMDILFKDCDAVCPCATGGILSATTIPQIRAPIVCGAANNQLAHLETDAPLLKKHNICYVPDFLVNRMGIVHCADEAAGYATPDPNIERHLGTEWDNAIYNLARSVLKQADSNQQTPQEIAMALAEERSRELHPITAHRSRVIIDTLVRSEEWLARIGRQTA
ncbi:hypothetical protein SYNPS1DRAFT_29438 [Syncephalis pseudoplumigaleata]|uniref:Glutamate/phenylalanine/leucine/valine/L-tryptophan dehydrogenase C-terminal domain-containing protein n=1 Tax=Syncephalis pseudoplumigaleata TaxID=1712513 RepID=A0A4V1J1E8_9FUNG|nr:hypothetical protein SYNPS1DRAFT_29438 [Syncephalis pseudoplumigaleata]|eukprot:RKP24809.1 hypothetical protein SYNPS1DRAFT_29438 [Syncephalis pseudoplumigaleata]